MKIPEKQNNIYPKTKKNLKSLINFYFDNLEPDRSGVIKYLLSKTSLSLNQIEFIVKKVAENYNFLNQQFSDKSLLNFLKTSVEVITKQSDEWQGSLNRIELLSKIKNYFENKIDLDDDYFIGTPIIIKEPNNTEELNTKIIPEVEELTDENYYDEDDYYENNDYERDSFYALTDGQYGDYEDWKENGGDLDDLMEQLGH